VIKGPSQNILLDKKIERIETLLQKIKTRVEQIQEKHPQRAKLILQKISLIEAKLLTYKPQDEINIDVTKEQKAIKINAQNTMTNQIDGQIKHTMMISANEPQLENIVHQESKQIEPVLDIEDSDADIFLPLPPPPRMV
jgi:tRNA U34 5-carboxymethylaminomethyl modifying enzyme MnmG/GidA